MLYLDCRGGGLVAGGARCKQWRYTIFWTVREQF